MTFFPGQSLLLSTTVLNDTMGFLVGIQSFLLTFGIHAQWCLLVSCSFHEPWYMNEMRYPHCSHFNWYILSHKSLPYLCLPSYIVNCFIYISVYGMIEYQLCSYCMAQNFDGGKFWRMGMWKILTKNFLTNFIMLTPTFINSWRDWRGKTAWALITIMPIA